MEFKKITFFHDKIISNKIGTMFQTFKNKKIINKFRNYVPNIIFGSPFIRNAKALGQNPSQIRAIQLDAQVKCIISTIKLDAQAKFPITRLISYAKGLN